VDRASRHLASSSSHAARPSGRRHGRRHHRDHHPRVRHRRDRHDHHLVHRLVRERPLLAHQVPEAPGAVPRLREVPPLAQAPAVRREPEV